MKTLKLETPNGFIFEIQAHSSRPAFLRWINNKLPGGPKAPAAYCCMFEDRSIRIILPQQTPPYSPDIVHEALHAVDFCSNRIPKNLNRCEFRAYMLNALLEFHRIWHSNNFEIDNVDFGTAYWYLGTALHYEKEPVDTQP